MSRYQKHPRWRTRTRTANRRRPVPLNVWLCADHRVGASRRECPRHSTRIARRLADGLITHLSPRDGLVVDTYTESIAVIDAALRHGRRGIVFARDQAVTDALNQQLAGRRPAEQANRAEARTSRRGRLRETLADHAGRIDLLVVPAPATGTAPSRARSRPKEPVDGHATIGCLLRPGGTTAVIVGAERRATNIATLVQAFTCQGLIYVQHVIAIHAPVARDQFVAETFRDCPGCVNEQIDPHEPVRVHTDVLVFTRPHRRPLGTPAMNSPVPVGKATSAANTGPITEG